MSGAAKNLIAILGLATIAFAGYYFYQQQSATTLSNGIEDQAVLDSMLMKTQVFIGRRQALDAVIVNQELFRDPRFTSLRSFTDPLQDMPTGRPDPFAPLGQNYINNEPAE